MAINVIFNDFEYEILPKQRETWDRYCKILQWGRQHPTHFVEEFLQLELTDYQKYLFMNSWIASTSVILCSRATGKAESLDEEVYWIKDGNYNVETGEGIEKKRFNNIKVGDYILNEYLQPTQVIHLNPIIFDLPYTVIFEDGEQIKCNGEHLWKVYELDSEEPNKWNLCVRNTDYLYCHYKDNIMSNKTGISDKSKKYKFIVDDISAYIKQKPQELHGVYTKAIVEIKKGYKKEAMRCITVDNPTGCYLTGSNYTVTHNSFFSAPFIMTRSLLIPNHKTFILSVSGAQASSTFTKMEDLAFNNIASAVGVSSVFLENVVRPNTRLSGFTHDKTGMHVELFNGSEVTSLNSLPETLRGSRSNLNVYDEAAFIPKEVYVASLPFTAVSSDFRSSKNLNTEIFPHQIPNLNLFLSSASDTTSEMYAQYKEAFRQMMLGNTNYFVADLDYHVSTKPFMNGKPMKPLVSMEEVERLYATQPYKAEREFGNKWSSDQSEDTLVKRSTLNKFSQTYYPIFKNDGSRKFIITYDPSSRQDNSVILVSEIIRDKEKGLMLKLSHMKNLVEQLGNGQVAIIQKPQQVEILKQMMLDYNQGFVDYDGLDSIFIDGGAGGGGFEISQYLLTDFEGTDKRMHRGIIDVENEYMSLRQDDYPQAARILKIFNFKKDKTRAYEAMASAINQGLIIWPKGLNVRNQLEFEEVDSEGNMSMRYEKPNLVEIDSLIQFDLAREEILGMQRSKRGNGMVVIEQTPEAKQNGLHDDRADVIAMACFRLMELRANEALDIDKPIDDFSKVYGLKQKSTQNVVNPFAQFKSKNSNPFVRNGLNPFGKR